MTIRVLFSKERMTAGQAQAIDSHSNKESKRKKSQKVKYHSFNNYILSVATCPIYLEHRNGQNKQKSLFLCYLLWRERQNMC